MPKDESTQASVVDTVVNFLSARGWKILFVTKPGTNYGIQGNVVPLNSEYPDIVAFKGRQLFICEVNRKIGRAAARRYYYKIRRYERFLFDKENLHSWAQEVARKNNVKLSPPDSCLFAISYRKMVSEWKRRCADEGISLLKCKEGKVLIEEQGVERKFGGCVVL